MFVCSLFCCCGVIIIVVVVVAILVFLNYWSRRRAARANELFMSEKASILYVCVYISKQRRLKLIERTRERTENEESKNREREREEKCLLDWRRLHDTEMHALKNEVESNGSKSNNTEWKKNQMKEKK